jgi:hypothetical protein
MSYLKLQVHFGGDIHEVFKTIHLRDMLKIIE